MEQLTDGQVLSLTYLSSVFSFFLLWGGSKSKPPWPFAFFKLTAWQPLHRQHLHTAAVVFKQFS